MNETNNTPEKTGLFVVGTAGGAEKIRSPQLIQPQDLEQLVFRPAYEQGLASIEFQVDGGDGKPSSNCSYTVAFDSPNSCIIWSHFPPDDQLELRILGKSLSTPQQEGVPQLALSKEDGRRHSHVLHEVLTPLIEKFGSKLRAENSPIPEVLNVDITKRIESVRNMSKYRVKQIDQKD